MIGKVALRGNGLGACVWVAVACAALPALALGQDAGLAPGLTQQGEDWADERPPAPPPEPPEPKAPPQRPDDWTVEAPPAPPPQPLPAVPAQAVSLSTSGAFARTSLLASEGGVHLALVGALTGL